MRRSSIYLAAPFFSAGERQFNEQVLRLLESAWSVYYPHRDGVRMAQLVERGAEPSHAAQEVWRCDFAELSACRVIVAILDGRVPDEGVCVEIGLARGLGKVVVGVSTDSRGCFPWGANPMITSCLDCLCKDLALLVPTVRQRMSLVEDSAAQLGG